MAYIFRGKQININAPFTDPVTGITYPDLTNSCIRAQVGVIEIENLVNPDPDKYIVSYDPVKAGFVLVELPAETQQQNAIRKLKEERSRQMQSLTVVIDGMQINGDEVSQARMGRVYQTMQDDQTVTWILADGSMADLTKTQIGDALAASVEKMIKIWVTPYQKKDK